MREPKKKPSWVPDLWQRYYYYEKCPENPTGYRVISRSASPYCRFDRIEGGIFSTRQKAVSALRSILRQEGKMVGNTLIEQGEEDGKEGS